MRMVWGLPVMVSTEPSGNGEEAGEGVGHCVAHAEVHHHAGEDEHNRVVHDHGGSGEPSKEVGEVWRQRPAGHNHTKPKSCWLTRTGGGPGPAWSV